MTSRMDEFRTFVQNHSKVREDVREGKRTWQNIYEEWVLYGENDPQWEQYKTVENDNSKQTQTNDNNRNGLFGSLNMGNVKNVLSQVQKFDPNKINNTLNSVQKVIQIAQSVTGSKAAAAAPLFASAYSDWWD